jgi:WD40 repeat protein
MIRIFTPIRIPLIVLSFLMCGAALSPQETATQSIPAQPIKAFPTPDIILHDEKHKEPKSGVQLQGGQLTIMSGVGTPTVINAFSFSADGNTLAAAKDFGRVVIWNVAKKKFLRALETSQGIVDAVAVSPDGKTVTTSGKGDDFSVKTWDVATGKILKELRNNQAPILTLEYDDTGQSLVVSDNAGVVRAFNVSGWEPSFTLNGVHAPMMAQDRKSLVTVDEKEIATWSCASWSKVQAKPIPKGFPLLVAAHTGEDRLGVYQFKRMRIMRGSTGEVLLERADFFPKNFTWRPTFAGFSSDGTLLYASMDDRLWLWNIEKNQACSTPTMYSGTASVSPDGHWLAGAKDDSIVSKERTDGVWIWDTRHLATSCTAN